MSQPTSPDRPLRRRRWRVRLALALGVLLACAVAAEITVRLVEGPAELRRGYRWTVGTHLVDLSWEEFCERQAAIQAVRRSQGMERGQDHPELAWTYNPGFKIDLPGARIQINSFGLRGEEFPLEKPEGEIRILCLGGSTTAGEEVANHETYPARIQELLGQRFPGRPLRVINAGIPSYAVKHSLRDFSLRLWRLNPDIVTIYHGINELFYHTSATIEVRPKQNYTGKRFTPFVYEGDAAEESFGLGNFLAPFRALARQSRAASLLHHTLSDLRSGQTQPAITKLRPEAIEAFRSYYRALAHEISSEGAQAVPITFCLAYPGQFTADQQRRVDASYNIWLEGASRDLGRQIIDAQNDAVRQIGEEMGLVVAEGAPAVPADAEHFIDICHFSAAGNRVLAAAVAETLAPIVAERIQPPSIEPASASSATSQVDPDR